MDWASLLVDIAIATVFAVIIAVIGSTIKERLKEYKAVLQDDHERIGKSIDKATDRMEDSIVGTTSAVSTLHHSFLDFQTKAAVAENEKQHRYENLKGKQKEIVDSIEKLSDFSQLLQKQEETIRNQAQTIHDLQQKIQLLQAERNPSRARGRSQDTEMEFGD